MPHDEARRCGRRFTRAEPAEVQAALHHLDGRTQAGGFDHHVTEVYRGWGCEVWP
jgi:hypothetical protein